MKFWKKTGMLVASLVTSFSVLGFAYAGIAWGLNIGGFGGFLLGAVGSGWGAVAGIAVAGAAGALLGVGIGL